MAFTSQGGGGRREGGRAARKDAHVSACEQDKEQRWASLTAAVLFVMKPGSCDPKHEGGRTEIPSPSWLYTSDKSV